MTAKIAGLAMLCHAIENASPAKTQGHEGLSREIKYPTEATQMKTRKARRRPARSGRRPPC